MTRARAQGGRLPVKIFRDDFGGHWGGAIADAFKVEKNLPGRFLTARELERIVMEDQERFEFAPDVRAVRAQQEEMTFE